MAKKGYIDVYKCREAFYNDVLSILSDDTANDRANEIIDVFDNLPAADVQEVVRCKDCKHNGYCTVQDYVMFKDDNYCSRGIRTDGEENENV